MERRRIDIEVTEIIIEEAKEAYIEDVKGVSYSDVLDVFENKPRFFVSYGARGERFEMLGPNASGRFLLTGMAEVDGGTWRVVTAYWLRSSRGRRLYGEETEDDDV
jgi:hypothetical protein